MVAMCDIRISTWCMKIVPHFDAFCNFKLKVTLLQAWQNQKALRKRQGAEKMPGRWGKTTGRRRKQQGAVPCHFGLARTLVVQYCSQGIECHANPLTLPLLALKVLETLGRCSMCYSSVWPLGFLNHFHWSVSYLLRYLNVRDVCNG